MNEYISYGRAESGWLGWQTRMPEVQWPYMCGLQNLTGLVMSVIMLSDWHWLWLARLAWTDGTARQCPAGQSSRLECYYLHVHVRLCEFSGTCPDHGPDGCTPRPLRRSLPFIKFYSRCKCMVHCNKLGTFCSVVSRCSLIPAWDIMQ